MVRERWWLHLFYYYPLTLHGTHQTEITKLCRSNYFVVGRTRRRSRSPILVHVHNTVEWWYCNEVNLSPLHCSSIHTFIHATLLPYIQSIHIYECNIQQYTFNKEIIVCWGWEGSRIGLKISRVLDVDPTSFRWVQAAFNVVVVRQQSAAKRKLEQ